MAGAGTQAAAGAQRASLPPDCETLIRRMLVVDPAKRITIAQIRQHRWMQAEPAVPWPPCTACPALGCTSNLGQYDERALGIMDTLGIDRQRTVEVRTPPPGRAGSAGRGAAPRDSRRSPVGLKREHGLI